MWSLFASRGFVLVLAVVGAALLLQRGLDAIGGAEGVRDRFGPFAPVASALIQAPLAASPFPSEVFALSHGPLYGFWVGALVGWAGWFLGSLLEFGVLQRWRIESASTIPLQRPRWLARFPVSHPVFLIGVRQLPAGYHLVNVAAAMTRVPFGRFAWCSALAQIPSAFFIAAVGLGLVSL